MFNGLMFDAGGGGGGTGDFVGPASSTDNAVVVFDGATGKIGKNSSVTISSGNLTANRATLATGDSGGALIGSTLFREVGGGVVATDSAITAYRTITGLELNATGGVNASGDITAGTSGQHKISTDVGIGRSAASVLRVTNGSTGTGALLHRTLIENSTAGTGAPNVILSTESGTSFTNTGAAEHTYHNLPAAEAGLWYRFINTGTGWRTYVTAAAGDFISDGTAASSSGGTAMTSEVIGSFTLEAVDSTNWVVTSFGQGTSVVLA